MFNYYAVTWITEDVEADNAQTKTKGLSGVTLQDTGKEASS